MSRKSIFSISILSCVLLTYWACGLSDPKYVNYVESDLPDSNPEPPSECETEALGLFTTNLQPALVATCAGNGSGCHSATPIGDSTLSTTSAEENRTVLKSYVNGAAQGLYDYISGATPGHGGGPQTAIELAPLDEWVKKEVECDAEASG